MADWCSIDFETRSDIDLTKTGVYRYVESRHTDVWCMAWAFDWNPVQLWRKGDPLPQAVVEHVKRGGAVRAWNAQFERVVWNYVLHARQGWPKLHLEQTYCTQAQALNMGLPMALDKAAEALALRTRKDPEGRKLMLQMCKPRLRNTDGSCFWYDDEDRQRRLGLYCVQDVETERGVGSRLHPMSDEERRVYLLDQTINERGFMLDSELIHAGITMVGQAMRYLDTDVKRLTSGMVENTRKRTQLLNWLWLHGDLDVDVDSIDKHALAKLLRLDDLTAATRCVLTIRQEAAKSSTAKLSRMQQAMNRDGRMRGTFQYYGARQTGRWAGRLIQPHNFPKGHISAGEQEAIIADVKRSDETLDFGFIEVLHGAPLDVMASLLRGCIVAALGKILYVVDFAAIEARILAWLAGQRDLLHLFAGGGDPYKTMAAKVYRKLVADVVTEERWLGKQLVLGCGYQQGWDSLRQRLAKEGLEVDEDFARECIGSYRDSNGNITDLWFKMQEAAMSAIAQPGVVYSNGKIGFLVRGGILLMKLPSGRKLAYLRPSVERVTTMHNGEPWTRDEIIFWGVDPVTYQWAKLYTYGGKLVENAVQAIARDVLTEAMLRAEARGYPVVLHVHDEIVAEVPEDFGDVGELCELTAEVPLWLQGCPIKAEGWRGRRYRK